MFSNPKHNITELSLDPGMIVADLGSGSGHYSLLAAHLVGGSGKVYAIDVQKDMLSKLKSEANLKHLRNIEVIWGDVEKPQGTRLKDAAVDVVIASNILFQITDKKAFIGEVKRILRPKGRLLLIDWTDSFNGMGPHADHVVKESTAKKLVEEAGFSYERSIKPGGHHYGMILRRV